MNDLGIAETVEGLAIESIQSVKSLRLSPLRCEEVKKIEDRLPALHAPRLLPSPRGDKPAVTNGMIGNIVNHEAQN
jgi:hypothetical protein